MTHVLALPPGTELVGDFRIERVLGAGGFGMTYLAEEIALARQVTIKEYFPADFAARGQAGAAVPRDDDSKEDFQWGLDRFIDEAQTLARFDHPNIVKVFRYFKANGTAYMVLSFEEGPSLKTWLRGLGRAPRQREIDDVLKPLLDALEVIHAADFLHRDIAPDNIIIRQDGTPVLIDFGSARGDIAKHSRTISALVKPGYSPYEQYAETGTRQGPWTDIYALGATLYHMISGKRPSDAPSRVVKDELPPAREAALAAYRQRFLSAVDKAIELDPAARPQSVAAWRGDLLAPDPSRPGWLARAVGKGGEAEPAGKTRPAAAPAAGMPLPDAPAPEGALLDYIAVLKGGSAAEPGSQAGPAGLVASPGLSSAATAATKVPTKPSGQARPTAEKHSHVPVPAKERPARPRANRSAASRRWRSFAIKFLIGAGIAGGAIAFKDSMPGMIAGSGGVPDGAVSVGAPRKANAALAPRSNSQRATMVSGHGGGATAVAFTGDGRHMVTGGADGRLKVWGAEDGALLRTLSLEGAAPTSLALSGRRAATGHADGHVAVWDIDSGSRLARFRRSNAAITSVAFSRDGDKVIASARDSMLAIWDPAAPHVQPATIEAHDGSVSAAAYAARGPYIATGGADRVVRLWRAGDGHLVRTYRGHKDEVTALAFSPDGRYIAPAAADGRIRVWSTSSSSLYRLSSTHKGALGGLAFSPEGDLLASAGQDGSVQLWQLRQGRTIHALAEQGTPARALAFAPDGRRTAVAGADGTVRFWDISPPGRR